MTDLDVIERLQRFTGMGRINEKKTPEGHKRAWVWCVSDRESLYELVDAIMPWLGERRSAKCRDLLDYMNSTKATSFSKRPNGDDCPYYVPNSRKGYNAHYRKKEMACKRCTLAQRVVANSKL